MFFEIALASRSTIAMGTRTGFFGAPPITAPKKAPMRIGAASVTASARRLEKYSTRSLRTRAARALMVNPSAGGR
jgi:hypothetical protein